MNKFLSEVNFDIRFLALMKRQKNSLVRKMKYTIEVIIKIT